MLGPMPRAKGKWLLLAMAVAVAGFAPHLAVDCKAIKRALDIDKDDDEKVELNEVLATASVLREAGCTEFVESDEGLTERTRVTCDTLKDDDALGEEEFARCADNQPTAAVEALVQCVEAATEKCGFKLGEIVIQSGYTNRRRAAVPAIFPVLGVIAIVAPAVHAIVGKSFSEIFSGE